ncbi:MAG: hypothetical protein JO152_14345 [Mycobacteriaceae bacterium]|nr:hypothetical protein [Mycobacteriaceae bacterium]
MGAQGRPHADGPAPGTAPVPPTAQVGDGRSPHYLPPAGQPPQNEAPAVAPPPPPPPAQVVVVPPRRSWADDLRSASSLVQLDGARTDPLSDPLFGLAGLVLLPAAGVVLGYRQAKAQRAAQAVIHRSLK